MTSKRVSKRPTDSKRLKNSKKTGAKKKRVAAAVPDYRGELLIWTGLSGPGKLTALKAFEDLGYYSVDNLPLELVTRFADLVRQSAEIERAALVVDVREGMRLDEFPSVISKDASEIVYRETQIDTIAIDLALSIPQGRKQTRSDIQNGNLHIAVWSACNRSMTPRSFSRTSSSGFQ